MAIKAKASKQNGLIIPAAYILVNAIQATKFLRPSAQPDPDTGKVVLVDAVQYVGRVQIYWNEETRRTAFGDAMAVLAFEFSHTNGRDPVHECYQHIKTARLEGWTLADMVDIFEENQP